MFKQLIDGITKSQAVQGALVSAITDIFVAKTDRDSGYTEVKYANDGDRLEVVGLDPLDPTMARVINLDNSNETEFVNLTDLEEIM